MRIHRSLLALLAVALLSVAACSSAPAGPSAASVQTAIENATKVKLVAQPLGAGAPSGAAVLANTPTIATDLQVVFVVVADTAANAKTIADSLTPSLSGFGGSAKTYTNKNVVVVYGPLPGGTDNSAAVDSAVKAF